MNDDFVKDVSSQMVINTNDNDFQRYVMKRQKAMEQKQMISDIANLKREVEELKKAIASINSRSQ
jgi:5,10-methylene-tetrahydrofolate dehydrogenase/methenyl tetrahydrofolate cyclohydrolase